MDTNECSTSDHSCSGIQNCVNLHGSYRCDCKSGKYLTVDFCEVSNSQLHIRLRKNW